ncbi:sulfatase family protein [Dysgonomonas termitidis]|uniref:Sulfatase n=1 Tax=Dysgonomonas termitidis TaxID=1516126 RepID=A0ABV9L1Z3_9BACT
MKRFPYKKVFAGLYSASVAVAGGSLLHAQTNADRPNILFIMSDDHTSQAISAYGGYLAPYLPTPNIDRIANEGVRMDNCFVTNSISTPSRACILTGQYSQKNGVYTLDDSLNPALPTVAKELQRSGYQTAIIGKWHLGTEPMGFDYYNVLPGQGRYHNPLFIEKGDWDKGEGGKPKTTEYKGHSTDVIADETIKYLQSAGKDKPFFVMCHFKAPHRPWEPAERFRKLLDSVAIPEPRNLLDTYEGKGLYTHSLTMSMENMDWNDLKGNMPPENMSRDEKRHFVYQIYIKDYLRCIAGVDENIGRILNYLDEHGLSENTIVIYTGDQGFFLGEHGWFDKRLMYEECLRMPLLIRYPKEIKPKGINKDIVLNLDFAPLFLDYAGIETPGYMQGESFRKNLQGKTTRDWRKSMYYRYWMNDDWHHHVPGNYGIRTDRYKLIYYYAQSLGMSGTGKKALKPEWELYDLQEDPAEMHNIYSDPANRELIKLLKEELLLLKEKYGDEDKNYPEMERLNEKYW